MTIAIISMIRDNWGGSEELWASMAEEALGRDYKVLHLSYQTSDLHTKMRSLVDKGLITYTRPSYREVSTNAMIQFIGKSINYLRKKISAAYIKIFQHNPDIIIYNGTCYSIADEHWLLQKLGVSNVKFFLIGHFNDERGRGGLSDSQARLVRTAYDRAEKVMFISERSMRNAKRQVVSDIENGMVVRNPVNLSSTDLVDYPEGLPVQMAMVGNLRVVHKGQDIALTVLSQDVWKNRDWRLNIYGAGEDENYLREIVRFHNLTDKVIFHGKVSDIRRVWERNHLLLMPSHMEGMPLAMVEAMLCGRVCVATDVGGIAEWIEEGVCGFIAEAPTVSSFGAAMEKAWKHSGLWKQMGVIAHKRAMMLYDPEPGKTLLKLITESIG